jgi:methyl-accepting chemotaxis protein
MCHLEVTARVMQIRDLSISAKTTIATTAVVLLLFIVAVGGILLVLQQVYTERDRVVRSTAQDPTGPAYAEAREKSVRSIDAMGSLLAQLAGQGLRPTVDSGLERAAERVVRDPEVRYVRIRDARGQVRLEVAASGVDTTRDSGAFREFPIPEGTRDRGTVTLGVTGFLAPTAQSAVQAVTDDFLAANRLSNEVAIALIIAIALLGAVGAALLVQLSIAQLTRRFIIQPSQRIIGALTYMERRRDYSNRVPRGADDELGHLVDAFNRSLTFLDRENDQLNTSIVELLEAAAEISRQRDLRVQAPVREDITGPLADALNSLTQATANVLYEVRQIANDVLVGSQNVQSQGQEVLRVAHNEQENIENTSQALAETLQAIDRIAALAQEGNESAKRATASTDQALGSVQQAIDGMAEVRESIQETGKRIKRLSERSQEISGIIDIINSFAERTHVLAINASMQAANAGEAGRGFAVVAHEVQRLADSSRNATSQISSLVNNIQVETSDTIQTVNQATDAVALRSRTVEQAGSQMEETQQTNAQLAEAVQQIYERSQAQAEANHQIVERVDAMRAGTVETMGQIEEQEQQTHQLVRSADDLLRSIAQFKLPDTGPTQPARSDGATRGSDAVSADAEVATA